MTHCLWNNHHLRNHIYLKRACLPFSVTPPVADTVSLVHLRESGAWSPLLLAFVASAPVLMELCGSSPSTDGLNRINLCLFCPNVDGANPEIAFRSEELLFLREQNQFSMTMQGVKRLLKWSIFHLSQICAFEGFLHFLPSSSYVETVVFGICTWESISIWNFKCITTCLASVSL